MAAIYKIFGYNFFFGRYFSVALSFACIILVYLIVKKFYNPTAGLIASLLFTIFPGFDLLWYRVVQEPLGIFLVLLALFFASDYIKSRDRRYYLLFSGVCLGLAVATKYTFISAALGFIIAIWVSSTDWQFRNFKSYFSGLRKIDVWLLVTGTVAGFLLIAGFFIVRFPNQFIFQTFSSQTGYRIGNTGSYILSQLKQLPLGIQEIFQLIKGYIQNTVAIICLLAALLLLIMLFFKRKRSRPDIFLLIVILVCLPLCALFNPFGEMRYFVSFYVFTLIAITTFIPEINVKTSINYGIIVSTLAITVFMFGTIALRMDYNFLDSNNWTYEEQAYRDTISYLESVGATHVYTMNPIIIALAPNLNPNPLDFDTFGNVMIIKKSPDVFYTEILNQETDYAVIDDSSLFSIHPGAQSIGDISIEIREHGVLVKNITPNDVGILGTAIFKVTNP